MSVLYFTSWFRNVVSGGTGTTFLGVGGWVSVLFLNSIKIMVQCAVGVNPGNVIKIYTLFLE